MPKPQPPPPSPPQEPQPPPTSRHPRPPTPPPSSWKNAKRLATCIPNNYGKRGCYDVIHEDQDFCPILRPRSVPVQKETGAERQPLRSKRDFSFTEMVDLIAPFPGVEADENEMVYYPRERGVDVESAQEEQGGEAPPAPVAPSGNQGAVTAEVKRRLSVLAHFLETRKTYLLLVLLTTGIVLELIQTIHGPTEMIQVSSPPAELHLPQEVLNATFEALNASFGVLEKATQVQTVAIQLVDLLKADLAIAAAARGHHTAIVPSDPNSTGSVPLVHHQVNTQEETPEETPEETQEKTKDDDEDDDEDDFEDDSNYQYDDNTDVYDDNATDTAVEAAADAGAAAAAYVPGQALRPRFPHFPTQGGR
jgi:hypothetical protein